MCISDAQVEKITRAVLEHEFTEAAEAYADEMLANIASLEVGSIRQLMRLRERFLNARRMVLAE